MKQIRFTFLMVIMTIRAVMAQSSATQVGKQLEFTDNNVTKYTTNCNEIFTGEGTYYGYSGGGNCSFPNPSSPVYTAAMNQSQYAGSLTCGTCVAVTGERGTLVVSIEDRCPECSFGDIDLSTLAFEKIADPIKGRVPISWKIVACPYNNPVKFRFKEGSSQYWTAVQIRNHRYPVAKLEYKVNGSYISINREMYNYFVVPSGMGIGPYDFRLTDIYGNVIEERNIPLTLNQDINGIKQFALCNTLSIDNRFNAVMDQKINLFPNPVKDELSLNYSLIENAQVAISIYDIFGKQVIGEVKEKQFVGKIERTINVEKLQNGIYFAKINVNDAQYVQKIVIYKNN
jgi:expansin